MKDIKNRYALVCVDYATKYPEAIPLKDQVAGIVADALISLLSSVGIPIKGIVKAVTLCQNG